MNGPNEAENGTDIACAVCDDPMPFDEGAQLRHDDQLGYICQSCAWRIAIAKAHLKEHGMPICQYKPEPNESP